MAEPKTKADKEAGNLSASAKTHCVDLWVSERYNRNTDVFGRAVQKGLMVEEDSITLYSRLKKRFYKKNEEHLSNEFIKGTPDLYLGKDIKHADEVTDIKSSWDIYTFSRVRTKPVDDIYFWQVQGYMILTNAKKSSLAYCLINTPEVLINDEKRKMMWRMGAATEESEAYLEACKELEFSMRFDDIPMQERMIEFHIDFEKDCEEALFSKIKKAREFIRQLDINVDPSGMIAEYSQELKTTIVESL